MSNITDTIIILKPGVTKKHLGALLGERGVNIVDLVQTPQSDELISLIAHCFESEYGVSVSFGDLNEAKFNVRIIYSDEYCEDNNLDDPHDQNLGTVIIQHINVETLDTIKREKKVENQLKRASTICAKTAQELILKNDVRNNFISIYDWTHLSFQKEWTFVLREKIQDDSISDDDSSKGHKKADFEHYCVKIKKDGNMEFSHFKNDHPILCPIFDVLSFQLKSYGTIEGFVFTGEDNVHAIVRSKEKTMPDISMIWKGLKDTNDNAPVPRDVLISAIEAVCEMDPERFGDYSQTVIQTLMRQAPVITKKELRSIIQIGSKLGKEMNRKLCEHFGIWIYSEIRDSTFEETYRLGDIAGIQFFCETNDYGKSSFNYFVGPKRTGIGRSIPNASIIRKVYSLDGENEFEALLPLMSIEFVRNGMYTVLPFPFKYLREYVALNNISKSYDHTPSLQNNA